MSTHLLSERIGIHKGRLQQVNVFSKIGGHDLQQVKARPAIAQDRSDLILLLLYAPGATGEVFEPVEGKQRLFYELFLLGKEAGLERFEGFYQLDPILNGGYPVEADSDLKFLVGERIVREIPNGLAITQEYRELAKEIAKKYPPEIIQGISRVKARYNHLPQLTLFYYVFYKFIDSKPTSMEHIPVP
ncbi:MAG TPA: hypothetical protein VGS11_04485 [Candidatus Bathyarchaeia archaeon]|nr:hypothetical protein [Candidatus Bathyarchaeia archaeon]